MGDVCLISDSDKPCTLWKLAVIENLVVGGDGKVRAVNLRTSSGKTSRAISKLVPLEIRTDDAGWTPDDSTEESRREDPAQTSGSGTSATLVPARTSGSSTSASLDSARTSGSGTDATLVPVRTSDSASRSSGTKDLVRTSRGGANTETNQAIDRRRTLRDAGREAIKRLQTERL